MSEGPHNARQTTVLTVMVILFICMILGLIMISVSDGGDRHRAMAVCGKNLSYIQGATLAYITEEEQAFSVSWMASIGTAKDAREARGITCRILELIFLAESIPNKIAKCPTSKYSAVQEKPSKTVSSVKWGMGPKGVVSYAMDWAALVDSSADRVILADRDVDAHHGKVFACFGDGHVAQIKLTTEIVRKSGDLITEGCDGKPVVLGTAVGGSSDDDIYTSDGDGGDPLMMGKGDPLRAWVK